MKATTALGLFVSVTLVAYLAFWPVPIEPVAWNAPSNGGYSGLFAQNQHLSQVNRIELSDSEGPEDLAMDQSGNVYFSLLNGDIKRLLPNGTIETVINTKGRPLGIEFDSNGNLIIADAFRGLLSVSPAGQLTTLLTEVDGLPLKYADDVDVAENGLIYLSDASTKFHAEQYGTYAASLLDIIEHAGHGRIIEFDPVNNSATTLVGNLNFANGVTVSHDQTRVLFNETGSYRVLSVGLTGAERGKVDVIIDNLPGFPDNINRGSKGAYWIGLVSPRSKPLDLLSDFPELRKVVQRLPEVFRPKAKSFGHVIAINDLGAVVQNLQDPLGMYGYTTGALENGKWLYLSSLHEKALAVTANPHYDPKNDSE